MVWSEHWRIILYRRMPYGGLVGSGASIGGSFCAGECLMEGLFGVEHRKHLNRTISGSIHTRLVTWQLTAKSRSHN